MPKKTERRTVPRGLEHIAIGCVSPELDGGRFPVKRIVGDVVEIGADIFRDGHDLLAARVVYRRPGEATWRTIPLAYDHDSDRWSASLTLDQIGRWTYSVEAWTDVFATWPEGLKKKVDAGLNVEPELLAGSVMIRGASLSSKAAAPRAALSQTAKALADRGASSVEQKLKRAFDPQLVALMHEHCKPQDLTGFGRELSITVDQAKARFSSWYEFFPRSCATNRHGTFADAAKALPRIAELGFDVAYLPPIHPIGRTHRKGKNNSLTPRPDDVGSPWAIGNELGGHMAIEPALGTFADFDKFVAEAGRLGIAVALDYAPQCSPDHPWVKEHPEWFYVRRDGSIAYAENPPKKYQDIYPINFWCKDRIHLWDACREVVMFWAERGVKIFRVDNPHTKAFAFWEWMIADVQAKHPDVIFFAEAFTRPKRMKHLAKLGFTMSYTYFTWKNTAWELREYLEELQGESVEYYRPNFFANTPDILHEYLVAGGRPAFRIRLLLAATLSSLYGIYSGYELCENVPVKPGSEEYLDSEKYQLKPRDWNAKGNINADVALVNRLRREQPALQRTDNLTFHESDNPAVLFYGKGDLLIAVTTDPKNPQETVVGVPVKAMGLAEDESFVVRDLLTGAKYTWRGSRNYVRLDPVTGPIGHVFRVEKKA